MAKRARSGSARGGRDQIAGVLRVRAIELEAEGDAAVDLLLRVGTRFAATFAYRTMLHAIALALDGGGEEARTRHPTRKNLAERKRRSAGPMSRGRLQPASKADPELIVTTIGDWKKPPSAKP